ncbi:ATP-binding protein [Pseudaestuariivita atlantica]|uniref:ATP-binding protein n=1 Tax=Pseudaestuariivita atlantica TaxID=1317121 RepID=A0A0L1JLX8_9RHOB|nr:ATP-binding protein [Pseudaestuariivita atlantica]
MKSGAVWIASAPAEVRATFLSELGTGELLALPFLFDFWAHDHQIAPEGQWRSWVCLGGRGAGKTRAGAEWVRSMVEGSRPLDPGRARSVALVAETLEQAREVMVFGESGILAVSPPDRRPDWVASRRLLVWPNGAVARIFSAHDPERLRGPQFDAAWCDEYAKWPDGGRAMDNLQFALRLGDDPRQCVTTTPQNVPHLRELLAEKTTVTTHAPTEANAAYLASPFLDEVRRKYAGTRIGRQELDGELLTEIEGALWTSDMLDAARVDKTPDFDRVIVAVDPPVSEGSAADACGIVVAGAVTQGPPQDWRAYVLADETVEGASPTEWARAALAAYQRFGADRLVAEVNQGGALVETLMRQLDPGVPYKAVRASRGKVARAEPVAALYEQARVRHVAGLEALEDQMAQMTRAGFDGRGSPDRVDALVWALTDLMIEPMAEWSQPRMRVI